MGRPLEARDVLLVDDDPSGLAMLALALRRAGFSVVACSNPQRALAELARGSFRWLVTDAKMSPQDGFSLAEAAKHLAPDLRIVMISALYSNADIQGSPIERLFNKPVPVEALVGFLNGGKAPPRGP
ncbi:MAG: response regulator [Elusimicrobia bacterium]|nr:response regulator [Elusimicrobiota bacterium]